MSYICTKKVSLAGKQYYPGEVIPDDAFLDGSAAKLVKAGYVTETGGEVPAAYAPTSEARAWDDSVISVTLPGQNDGENVAYPVDTEQLQKIADYLQMTAGDASDAIGDEVDETVLSFIIACDCRKTVSAAAKKQLATVVALKGESSDPAGASAADTTNTDE